MMKLPQVNRHLVGATALALSILGLGIVGNSVFKRPMESLAQIDNPSSNPPTVAQNLESVSENLLSQFKRIPPNAYGYAPPLTQSQSAAADNDARGSEASEAKDWTKEEWRLASAAVAAYRKGGKRALNATSSSDIVWQPPEEIANQRAGKSQ